MSHARSPRLAHLGVTQPVPDPPEVGVAIAAHATSRWVVAPPPARSACLWGWRSDEGQRLGGLRRSRRA